jgi:serine/threonine-protein kinase
VDALLAAGRYGEAARALRRLGELERAQSLFEKIWDFHSAAEVARERGDRPALLRLLLDAREFTEAARVGQALHGSAPGEQARAAEVYERRRMWAEAAALRELLGELERAQQLFQKAQQPLEVARLDETLGRPREAGVGYERFLAAEPGSPEAPRVHLSLGRLLVGFGRHEEAVRHLQRAAADPAHETRARRLLTVELAALGYREAARTLLDALRAIDPGLPPLDAFIAAERRMLAEGTAARLAGRYLVRRLIGSGGMGRVYLATDELTSREVAVKVVAPPVDQRLADGYRRFVREAKVVSSLRHPNIVSVIEFHEQLGLLAMEHMAGGTLADRLPGPLSTAAVRALVLQLVSALESAHGHGVIHRDLKPANIFYSSSGEAKLGDFGVAHLQDLGATQTAGFIGTLAYMSPEQISGAPLSFAADVYALGVTMFQALTGRLPFRGPDFVGQHLGEPPPRPSSLRPVGAWDPVVARALAKDPRARFGSLEELRRAVAAIAVGQDAPAVASEPEALAARSDGPRYAVGGVVANTEVSVLEHATDTRLGREVILERFADGYFDAEAGAAHLAWLRAMARHGGPHLQRVLGIERQPACRAVYEAVTGPAPSGSLAPAALAALTRTLAPLHASGVAHGQVPTSIVLEDAGPTLLVAGRRPLAATPDDDLAALARLTTSAATPR